MSQPSPSPISNARSARGGRGASSGAPRGVVLAHPSGNQFFRHLAAALRDAGMLERIFTCIDWPRDGVLARWLPARIAAELGRRSFSADLGVRVEQRPWREIGRLAADRLGFASLGRHERGAFCVDAVYRDFDRWVARQLRRLDGASVVYAYEDGAEETFRAAGELGWRRCYDLPIAYWETSRRLLKEEAARWPAWEPTLVGTRDSVAKCERKTRELALADVVVCPSRFVVDSLPASLMAGKRVVLAPFGAPDVGLAPRAPKRVAKGPLRVLFVGSMTQRKGLADLFAAMRLLPGGAAELFVLGSPIVEPAFYRRAYPDFVYERPRPHADVLAFMSTCDVLCLPSIVEGRALVVQEAMSAALPAIVTPNTGADDVIEEGRNGFIVPIRSPEAIAAKLAWFIDHREAAAELGAQARAAAARFTWASYGKRVTSVLREK